MNHRQTFTNVAQSKPRKSRGWPHTYDELIKTIDILGRRTDDLNSVEPELRAAFTKFLTDSGYFLACKNFDALLAEKSGDNFMRNDGTVAWFHEFIPIMMVLSAIRKGQRGNGVDLKDIEAYGGIEVVIITHLRHDSVEDHILNSDAHTQQSEKLDYIRQQQYRMLEDIRAEGMELYANQRFSKVDIIVENIDLMSQRKLYDVDGNPIVVNGKHQKEDVVTYIARLSSSLSNPIVYILKQADIAHNFATMFGAEKFTPERRLKRFNEKENMYGARQNFYDAPKFLWKNFSKVIANFDGVVGDLLYKHFRYLENVDIVYKNSQDAFQREPNDFPVSSRFLKDALRVDLPEIIHPLHIGHKRMIQSVNPVTDPDKHNRLVRFMNYVIKPAIEHRKDRFLYLFPGSTGPKTEPVIALR